MSVQSMTAMQRTLATMSHKEPDCVPLFLSTTMHGARELNLQIDEYFSRAEYVVEGQTKLYEKFHGDCLNAGFYAALEAEAWGGTTLFLDDGPPQCGRPVVARASDIDTLRVPSIESTPGLERILQVIAGLKSRFGDEVPIVGSAISPFSLPILQMGFGPYLELIHDQPRRLDVLMQLNEEFCVAWANAQLHAGATAVGYADPMSSPTNTTRGQFLQIGYPIAQRVLARINGPVAIHLASGRCLTILEELISTGTAAIGVSGLEDLAELKVQASGRVTLLGNLNGVEMRRWSPAQAESEVKKAIAKAARGGGFILSDNHGEIPWQVPDHVLLALRAAVDRWGHYPLSWIDEEA